LEFGRWFNWHIDCFRRILFWKADNGGGLGAHGSPTRVSANKITFNVRVKESEFTLADK
jgi:hypothetical protein